MPKVSAIELAPCRSVAPDAGEGGGDQTLLGFDLRHDLLFEESGVVVATVFSCSRRTASTQVKLATTPPDLPADRVVPKIWLKMLSALRKRKLTTVRDFFRHLAGLLLCKRDGNPGWITLWRGLDKLLLTIRRYTAMNQKCG